MKHTGLSTQKKSYDVLLLLSGCMYEYGLFFICIVYPLKICNSGRCRA